MNYKEIYDKEYERVKNAMADDLYKGVQNAKSTEESYNSFSNDCLGKYWKFSKYLKESLNEIELKIYMKIIDDRMRYEKNKLNNAIEYKTIPYLKENDLTDKINLESIITTLAQVESTNYYINSFRNDYDIYTLLFEFNKLDQFLDIYYDRIDKNALETKLMDLKYPDRNKTWDQPLTFNLSTDQAQTPKEAANNQLNDDEKLLLLSELFNQTKKGNVQYLEFLKAIAITNNISTIDQVLSKGTGATQYKKFINGLNHYNNTKTKSDYCNSLINVLRSNNVESLITTFKSFLQRKS